MKKNLNRFVSNVENCFIDVITPEEAKEIVTKRNPNNRKITESTASSYKRQMLDNIWFFNGQSICFDINGNLIDGQHRLTACFKSNIPLKTVVVVGLQTKAYETTDIGKTRSYKDIVSATKNMTTDESITSEMAKKAFYLVKGAPTEHGSSTTRSNCANNSELLKFHKEHNLIFEELIPHIKRWKKNDRMGVFKRAEISGIASYLIIMGANKEKVLNFFDLLTGDNYSSNKTIETLRKKFENDKANRKYVKPLERFTAYKFGWSNYYNDKIVKKITSKTEYVNNWAI